MCLMELPIPTSLVDRSLLTQFHMETKGCFTIEQLYQFTFVTCICIIGIFRQTNLSQEAIRLTAGDGGRVLAVTHIQTLKIVSYK